MSTVFLGFNFIININSTWAGEATFYKLSTATADSFCDGPQKNTLATELLGSPSTGIPIQSFTSLRSNIFASGGSVDNIIRTPLNNINLILSSPCLNKCNIELMNNNIDYLTLSFYSDTDPLSGIDGMVIQIYPTINSPPKIITASLKRACVKPGISNDFLTAYISHTLDTIPKLIPNNFRTINTLNGKDIIDASVIQIDFYTNPNLMITSVPAGGTCCSFGQQKKLGSLPGQISPVPMIHSQQANNKPNRLSKPVEYFNNINQYCVSSNIIIIILVVIIIILLFYFYSDKYGIFKK